MAGGASARAACVAHLDHEQPLLLAPVALQETVLGPLEPLPGVVQAGQRLQSPVAPHDVQLQHSKVVHGAQQRRATLAGNTPTLRLVGGACKHGHAQLGRTLLRGAGTHLK